MSKEHISYKQSEGVVVKASSARYDGKYIATSRGVAGRALRSSKRSSGLRSSLYNTLNSVNEALKHSEEILPLTKSAGRK